MKKVASLQLKQSHKVLFPGSSHHILVHRSALYVVLILPHKVCVLRGQDLILLPLCSTSSPLFPACCGWCNLVPLHQFVLRHQPFCPPVVAVLKKICICFSHPPRTASSLLNTWHTLHGLGGRGLFSQEALSPTADVTLGRCRYLSEHVVLSL